MRPFSRDGKTYYHPTRAAQIIGLTPPTLTRWADAGFTSYGLPLTVRREGARRLIRADSVAVMAELNKKYPLPPKGPLPKAQLRDLQQAVRSYNARPQDHFRL